MNKESYKKKEFSRAWADLQTVEKAILGFSGLCLVFLLFHGLSTRNGVMVFFILVPIVVMIVAYWHYKN